MIPRNASKRVEISIGQMQRKKVKRRSPRRGPRDVKKKSYPLADGSPRRVIRDHGGSPYNKKLSPQARNSKKARGPTHRKKKTLPRQGQNASITKKKGFGRFTAGPRDTGGGS